MKCAVEGCAQEASEDCGFQQIGTVGEMEIKTSGLLCKSCFQQAMNGGRKEKQEYCAGCGIAFWKRITGEPVPTHMLNGKKYCTGCFRRQQTKQAKTCSTCGVDEFNDLEQCEHCEKLFCEGCIGGHWQQVHVRCYFCGGDSAIQQHGILYCSSCWVDYRVKERQKEESIKCADCGGTLKTSQFHNTIDAKIYCYPCYLKRQRQQQNQKNPFKGTYTYRMDWEPLIEEIFQRFFGGSAHFYSGSTAGQQQQTKTSGSYTYLPTEIKEAFKALGIEPVKDVEAIKKAYKALALVFHPDTGGDHKSMVTLNKAKDVVLKWAEGR